MDFLRFFVQHVYPHGFIRIHPGGVPHYVLAARNKAKELNEAKADLNQPIPIAIGSRPLEISLDEIIGLNELGSVLYFVEGPYNTSFELNCYALFHICISYLVLSNKGSKALFPIS
jgi:hypothetical protein